MKTEFIVACITLLLGHILRAIRWSLLLPNGDHIRKSQLFVSLSVGYALNIVLPLRVGELFRIFYLSARERVRVSPVAASVLVERASDIIGALVILIVVLVTFRFSLEIEEFINSLIFIALFLMVVYYGISSQKTVRKIVYKASSFFNAEIQVSILEFFWYFVRLVKENVILSASYLFISCGMWLLYVISYALVIGQIFEDRIGYFLELLFNSSIENILIAQISKFDIYTGLLVVVYLLFPIVVGLLYGIASDRTILFRSLKRMMPGYGLLSSINNVKAPNGFHSVSDFVLYLRSWFSGSDNTLNQFAVTGMTDNVVYRVFKGGSGAVTALIQSSDEFLIRKFGVGPAAEKLSIQADWLRKYKQTLPLAETRDLKFCNGSTYYDMEYCSASRDLYEVIHCYSADTGFKILTEVIEKVDLFHRSHSYNSANIDVVIEYIDTKISKNIFIIRNCIDGLFDSDVVHINEKPFDLNSWNFLLDQRYLLDVFKNRAQSTIHGDLTVENIIVDISCGYKWFLIDPNPNNIFNTPLIDWAKLFQSLHMGYEMLNSNVFCTVGNNSINYISPYTAAYKDLYLLLIEEMKKKFGSDGIQEILLHEIVNYLRLLPYKFKINYDSGVLFFAVCCELIQSYRDNYIND